MQSYLLWDAYIGGSLCRDINVRSGFWVLHQEVRSIRGIVAKEFSIRVTFKRSLCAFMIKVLQGNRTTSIYIWRVMGSCDYGGSEGPPTICCLQAGDPGVGGVIQSKAEGWELGRSVELMMWIPIWVWKSENQEHWSPRAELGISAPAEHPSTFWTFSRLDTAHLYWRGWFTLLSCLIQMLISSWNNIRQAQK